MLQSRGRWLAGLGAAAIATSTTARAQAQTPALTPITVTLAHVVDATPFYYALRQGLFENAGLTVTLTPLASGSLAIQAVVAGAAQIGLANTLSEAAAFQHGIPLVLIAGAGLYDANAPLVRIFVPADSAIRTAKDLEGHVVSVGGLHDLLALSVRAWLARGGADPSNVRFIELTQSAMLAALEQKRVDAIALFEPFASAAEASDKARSIGRPYDAISRQFSVSAWFTVGTWLSTHHEAAVRFAQVMRQATEYANAHLADMIPIVASYTGMTPEVVKIGLKAKMAERLVPAQLQPLIDTAVKFGELTAFPARDLLPGAP